MATEAPPASQPISELERKLLKQVEFYFGDANLPQDKFLLEKVKSDAEGWVPISVIASFSRVKALTDDASVLTAALRASPDLLELSQDETKVKRILPLDLSRNSLKSSIYAKGFPTTATFEEIEDFFGQTAKVLAVRMRRHAGSKAFKGSVFVELASEDEAERLAGMDHVYHDTKLVVYTKSRYFEIKGEERRDAKNKRKEASPSCADKDYDFSKGCLIKLSGIPQGTQWADVKAKLEPFATVAFVEFDKDDASTGLARLKEAKAADIVAQHHEKGLALSEGSSSIALSMPTEEEEKKYYGNLLAQLKEKAAQESQKRKGGNQRRGQKHAKRQ